MARTPKDPNPEFSQMPEMTIETVDYNMFYKPERASVSDGLVALSKSLSTNQTCLKFFDSFAPKAKPPGPQNNSAILIFLVTYNIFYLFWAYIKRR